MDYPPQRCRVCENALDFCDCLPRRYKPNTAEPEAKLCSGGTIAATKEQGNRTTLAELLADEERAPLRVPLGQSRTHSMLESLANIAFGFGISVLGNYLILPLYGMQSSLRYSVEIGVWFTLISFARSYALRRAFNWINIRTGRVRH